MSIGAATFWKKNTQHLIENYSLALADNFKGWICHHRLEQYYSATDLVMKGLYYNVNPEALKYVRKSEHFKEPHLGRKMTDEKRQKIADATKDAMIEFFKTRDGYWKGKHPHNHTKEQIDILRKNGDKFRGKTWKLIDGKRVWIEKEK